MHSLPNLPASVSHEVFASLCDLPPPRIDTPENRAQKYDVAMNLGEPARKTIKGNNLDFYLNLLQETRESTLVEFRKRDDQWLMTLDKTWVWGPTNTYCKWFHVCEHESHHQGQIALIKSRISGIKTAE